MLMSHEMRYERNVARLVYDTERGDVWIETEGNHDGVVVMTAVRVTRPEFVSAIKTLGVMS